MFVTILGYSAAFIEIAMGSPQAVHSFKQRNDHKALAGLSLPSVLLMFAHSLMWSVWAILVGEIPVLIAHCLSLPVYGAILVFVLRSRFYVKKHGNEPHRSKILLPK